MNFNTQNNYSLAIKLHLTDLNPVKFKRKLENFSLAAEVCSYESLRYAKFHAV